MKTRHLDLAIEAVLAAGLTASAALLVLGLLFDSTSSLRWGVILLMATPAGRVLVVTAGLIAERDWLFALVSLWILAVLASSCLVAMQA